MITGGLVSSTNQVELSISIGGGKGYKKIYKDVVSVAIDKFNLISSTLSKLLISKSSPCDKDFYIDQVKLLLQRSHVEMIMGALPFHNKYNMWLLDGYIRMLLETMDMKLISQLLDIDSILYSIEEAILMQNQYTAIDFEIPSTLKVKSLKEIDPKFDITMPVADELSAYLHSLNHNLNLLNAFINANRDAFFTIHKKIVETASKYLH